MTLTMPQQPMAPRELERWLNRFAAVFEKRTGRPARDIDLLRELRRMGYEAYLTDEEG